MADLNYRSWGETRNCRGCRNWSEMVASCGGNDSVMRAMCIAAASPNAAKMMPGHATCEQWQEGSLGACDQPGGDPYDAANACPQCDGTGMVPVQVCCGKRRGEDDGCCGDPDIDFDGCITCGGLGAARPTPEGAE